MKRMKKILAILLAVVMVMSMGMSAFAETLTDTYYDPTSGKTWYVQTVTTGLANDVESVVKYYDGADTDSANLKMVVTTYTDGTVTTDMYTNNVVSSSSTTYTITITNSTGATGHTYTAYQIFSGTVSGDSAPYVLSDIQWGSDMTGTGNKISDLLAALQSDSTLSSYFTSLYGVTYNESNDTSAAKVAAALSAITSNSDLAEYFAEFIKGYIIGNGTTSTEGSSATYTISGLDAGYYLVADTTDDADMSKNDARTDYILEVVASVSATTKTVVPTVTKTENVTSVDLGGTVTYTLTGTIPSDLSTYTTYSYKFVDTLSSGLTYTTNSLSVKDSANNSITSGYTLTVNNQEITVEFDDVKSYAGMSIIVTYEATINNSAVYGRAESNSVYVEYSNDPNGTGTGQTTTVEVQVTTYKLTGTKVDADNNSTLLGGAEFVLYKEEGATKYYYKIANNVVTWVTSIDDATVMTSDDTTGVFTFAGLATGTYYLLETKAPTGYNTLSTATEVTITSADGNAEVTVENNSGSTIPVTGGIGTTIFYIIGAVLVLGAGVILITRRRMATK